MDREKQIEEIDELLKKSIKNGLLDTKWLSKTIYNAEYRKKSEVAMEIIGKILLNHTPDIDGFFTMHETELAELKKKYEEGKK